MEPQWIRCDRHPQFVGTYAVTAAALTACLECTREREAAERAALELAARAFVSNNGGDRDG